VPVVVLSAELDTVLAQPSLLSKHDGVRVVGIPTDLETLKSVFGSVQRLADAQRRLTGQLPELCSHGFEFAADGRGADCGVCSWSA
jgi:hypothetical protein